MMDDQALDRLANVVYGDDRAIDALSFAKLASDLFATSRETPLWIVSVRNYNRILWWNHCARAYSFPRRKLRKCAMRRVVRRRQRERRRYI